jgi:PiT family inorganic phosphate transporter
VRAIKYRQALILATIGLFAGILLEGYKVSEAINSGVVKSNDPRFTLVVESSSLVLMVVLTFRRIPISLSQIAIGAAIGTAVVQGLGVNWYFVSVIAISWLLTPAVGFILALILSLTARLLLRRCGNILSLNLFYAYLTVFSGAYGAYTLGANTVGLMIGMNVGGVSRLLISVLFGFATVLGMLTLSRGTTQSVAENIVGLSPSASFAAQMGGALTVHGFTQAGIPVSVSQAVVGGIFGAALQRRIVVRNARLSREILIGWTIAPILGAMLAFLIATMI